MYYTVTAVAYPDRVIQLFHRNGSKVVGALTHNSDSDVCDVQTRMLCDNWRRFGLRGPAPTASVWTPSRPRLPRTRMRQTLSTETSEGRFLTLHPGASY